MQNCRRNNGRTANSLTRAAALRRRRWIERVAGRSYERSTVTRCKTSFVPTASNGEFPVAVEKDVHGKAAPRETPEIGRIRSGVWDLRSGGSALQSGIFLLWRKHSGYAKSLLIRSINSKMQPPSHGTLIGAGRSFIGCSGP